jgi:hypothetical protein
MASACLSAAPFSNAIPIVERYPARLWAEPNEGHGATSSFSIPHELQMI